MQFRECGQYQQLILKYQQLILKYPMTFLLKCGHLVYWSARTGIGYCCRNIFVYYLPTKILHLNEWENCCYCLRHHLHLSVENCNNWRRQKYKRISMKYIYIFLFLVSVITKQSRQMIQVCCMCFRKTVFVQFTNICRSNKTTLNFREDTLICIKQAQRRTKIFQIPKT